MNNKKNNRGFTLVEMIFVISLIALLGGWLISKMAGRLTRAKVQGTKIHMRQIVTSLDQFKLDCGFYPSTEQNLDALLKKPEGKECKNYDPEGYMSGKEKPKDPFGNDYVYFSDGNTYELKSFGADGKEGGSGNDADVTAEDLE